MSEGRKNGTNLFSNPVYVHLMTGGISSSQTSMNLNVRLYPFFNMFFNCFFWGGVFFLYFIERVSLQELLWLEGLYYFAVVFLEIPSGYFSDRVGRRKTLLISTISFFLANTAFYFGSLFWELVVAQFLMAVGYSFYSGTAHSFHYDSLKALEREREFGSREAKVMGLGLFFRAATSIMGGVSAMFALKNPYALTAATSLVCVVFAYKFKEPPRQAEGHVDLNKNFIGQLSACLKYLSQPPLAWLFCFMVLFTVVVHIPFEFFQPYVNLLRLDFAMSNGGGERWTPLITSIILAMGTFGAAIVATKSHWIRNRIGVGPTLLLAILIEVVIICAMGFFLHPIVIGLIVLRTVPEGLMHSPYTAQVNPLVDSRHRATFFSLNSFMGRLAYGLLLFLISAICGDDAFPQWAILSTILKIGASLALLGFLSLWITQGKLQNSSTEAGRP